MNYRHIYHAGNFADVLKHAVLARLIRYAQQKEGAFRVLDTHAGIGLYDLTSEEAQKTGEWQEGIGRLIDAELPEAAAALLEPYLSAVRDLNPEGGVRRYPGSPKLARMLFRPQDRLSAIELHPEDFSALSRLFEGDFQVRVTELDGWLTLGAHLPPKEKRGLVLIDPPFEAQLAEFDTALDALRTGLTRWPQGIFTLWYPIKQRRTLAKFLRDAVVLPSKSAWIAELHIRSTDSPLRMNGSGMLVLNPPWKADEAISPVLPRLAKILGEQDANSVFQWLKQGS